MPPGTYEKWTEDVLKCTWKKRRNWDRNNFIIIKMYWFLLFLLFTFFFFFFFFLCFPYFFFTYPYLTSTRLFLLFPFFLSLHFYPLYLCFSSLLSFSLPLYLLCFLLHLFSVSLTSPFSKNLFYPFYPLFPLFPFSDFPIGSIYLKKVLPPLFSVSFRVSLIDHVLNIKAVEARLAEIITWHKVSKTQSSYA